MDTETNWDKCPFGFGDWKKIENANLWTNMITNKYDHKLGSEECEACFKWLVKNNNNNNNIKEFK